MDSSKARPADRQPATSCRRCRTLRVIAASLSIGWPIAGVAQMVGPTPQPQGISVTPQQAEQVEEQVWAVHGQGTNVWLLEPAFRAPYSGPQSLAPVANGRETIDLTLYAGVRPIPAHSIAKSTFDDYVMEHKETIYSGIQRQKLGFG